MDEGFGRLWCMFTTVRSRRTIVGKLRTNLGSAQQLDELRGNNAPARSNP